MFGFYEGIENMSIEMRNCIGYGISFAPISEKQLYHNATCRDRIKARKYRLQRTLQDRCPQCGGKMDYPVSKHKTKGKYCNCRGTVCKVK